MIIIVTALTILLAATAGAAPSTNQQVFFVTHTNPLPTTLKIVYGSNVKTLEKIHALIKAGYGQFAPKYICHLPELRLHVTMGTT
uniref:Uncharacterized protein n=1 Tax=Romanomermis culicivorax TaxID=13658 RepID=A0A915I459_ROMCU